MPLISGRQLFLLDFDDVKCCVSGGLFQARQMESRRFDTTPRSIWLRERRGWRHGGEESKGVQSCVSKQFLIARLSMSTAAFLHEMDHQKPAGGPDDSQHVCKCGELRHRGSLQKSVLFGHFSVLCTFKGPLQSIQAPLLVGAI